MQLVILLAEKSTHDALCCHLQPLHSNTKQSLCRRGGPAITIPLCVVRLFDSHLFVTTILQLKKKIMDPIYTVNLQNKINFIKCIYIYTFDICFCTKVTMDILFFF